MNRKITGLIILACTGILIAVLILAAPASAPMDDKKELLCHVGGTMRPVMEKLSEEYFKKTGTKVEINTAGSGELLATIQMQQVGDLYVAHDPFMDRITKKGLAVNSWGIAEIFPVIIVQKGNPKHIQGMQDLVRPDVRLYLTDYVHSTLGNMLPVIFKRAGIDFRKLNREKEITTHRSGSYVANLIKMDAGDAAIVWQAVAFLRRDSLDSIRIDECLPVPYVDTITSATRKVYSLTPVKVTVSTLIMSQKKEEAGEFIRFLLSEEGARIIRDFGFATPENVRKQYYSNGLRVGTGNLIEKGE